MKRGWTILLAGVLILAIALPVGAEKPNCWELPDDHQLYCEPPEPPPPPSATTPPVAVDCQFDEEGILQNPWSEADGPYRCRWTTLERGPFTFHLTGDGGSVLRPHLFVTDAYPYGDRCFDALENGWHPLSDDLDSSYAWESFTLPDDGECDDSFPDPDPDGADVFSLVIAARVKGTTTPEVTVTQP